MGMLRRTWCFPYAGGHATGCIVSAGAGGTTMVRSTAGWLGAETVRKRPASQAWFRVFLHRITDSRHTSAVSQAKRPEMAVFLPDLNVFRRISTKVPSTTRIRTLGMLAKVCIFRIVRASGELCARIYISLLVGPERALLLPVGYSDGLLGLCKVLLRWRPTSAHPDRPRRPKTNGWCSSFPYAANAPENKDPLHGSRRR
jgi:hypothetical protein